MNSSFLGRKNRTKGISMLWPLHTFDAFDNAISIEYLQIVTPRGKASSETERKSICTL